MSERSRVEPISMHRHAPVTFDQPGDRCATDEAIKYYHGSMAWSYKFERYMRGVKPVELEVVLGHWREWWEDAYVVERLRHHMGERDADVAVAVASGRESYHELAKKNKKSVPWVDRQRRIAYRIVRENYHKYSRPRRTGNAVAQQSPGTVPNPPGE